MSADGRPESELAERVRDNSSGILTITDGRMRRLFCLSKGTLVHAASNIIEEQFEEFLVRERHIHAADRTRARLAAAQEKSDPLNWMVDQGLIDADTLETSVADHATEMLTTALQPKSAETSFVMGAPDLAGKPVTAVNLAAFLIGFLQTHPKSIREVRVRLGQPSLCPLRVDARETRVLELAEAHASVGQVWRLADGSLKVSELVKHVEAGEEAGLRALYGLVLLGAVTTLSADARKPRTGRRAPVTRTELLARLERAADATHYGVLELMANADKEAVRHSYYDLAQRYHPDRFRSGEHVSLLPRIEAFFAQVTEAYNTLSDPDARRSYDEGLAARDPQDRRGEAAYDTSYLARQNYLRAKAVAKRNQFQQAVTFLENALELEENVPEYHVELGAVLSRNPRRRDEAEQHLRRGIELDPTVAQGHVALADLLLKTERQDEARRVLTEGLKWVPGSTELSKRLEELGSEKGRGLFRR